mgnify:CR=1 FL=1
MDIVRKHKLTSKSISDVEVLELYDMISNTISYLWVRDISTRQYAVPNYLTSRRVNLRLIAKF